MMWWRLAVFWLLFLGACSPNATIIPTQTLIPPALTEPTPLTATTETLPSAVAPDAAGAETILIPASAQPLVSRAVADLSARLAVSPEQIRLTTLEQAAWSDDLNCEQPPGPTDNPLPGFRFILSVQSSDYEYHTDMNSRVELCTEISAPLSATMSGESETTDPIAAELIALARRRLAAQLDLAEQRVRLVQVATVTWPDTSLGCPQPDVQYEQRQVDGYRIVLAAGTSEYIFHTDFDRLVACDAADEVLSTPVD